MALKTRYTNVGGQVAAVKTGGQRYFVEPDALGNVRGLVNQSGVRSQTYTYWPYGEVRTSTGSVFQPLQFCGTWGYYTESSSKQYVRARYYMQSIGRWQTVDPLWPREMSYGYVTNEPISKTDASGMNQDDRCWPSPCAIFPGGPCAYAKSIGMDEGDIGGIACCDGKKMVCVWVAPTPGIKACVVEHETDHLPNNECPPKGFSRGTPTRDLHDQECNAHALGLRCLIRNRKIECGRLSGTARIACEQLYHEWICQVCGLMKNVYRCPPNKFTENCRYCR